MVKPRLAFRQRLAEIISMHYWESQFSILRTWFTISIISSKTSPLQCLCSKVTCWASASLASVDLVSRQDPRYNPSWNNDTWQRCHGYVLLRHPRRWVPVSPREERNSIFKNSIISCYAQENLHASHSFFDSTVLPVPNWTLNCPFHSFYRIELYRWVEYLGISHSLRTRKRLTISATLEEGLLQPIFVICRNCCRRICCIWRGASWEFEQFKFLTER